MVPVLNVICMALSMIATFSLPFVISRRLRLKYGASERAFAAGCLGMLVFSLLLEALVLFLLMRGKLEIWLSYRPVTKALFYGLVAAALEEPGRLIIYHTIMKNRRDRDVNAWMYGIGYGGFEGMITVGLPMLNYFIWSILINTGMVGTAEFNKTIYLLETSPAWLFLLLWFEQALWMLIYISFSVMVWFAMKRKNALYFAAAFLLHVLAQSAETYLSNNSESELVLTGVLLILCAVICFAGYAVRKKETNRAVTPDVQNAQENHG